MREWESERVRERESNRSARERADRSRSARERANDNVTIPSEEFFPRATIQPETHPKNKLPTGDDSRAHFFQATSYVHMWDDLK